MRGNFDIFLNFILKVQGGWHIKESVAKLIQIGEKINIYAIFGKSEIQKKEGFTLKQYDVIVFS